MQSRVERDLKEKITNLDMQTEDDWEVYEEICQENAPSMEKQKQACHQLQNLNGYSRRQLEERYCAMAIISCTEAMEYMTLLCVLDLKVSRTVSLLRERCEKHPLMPGELAQILEEAGFFSEHKFYRTTEETKEESQSLPKPKRDRGHLKLIK